jgi:hypothetical protein
MRDCSWSRESAVAEGPYLGISLSDFHRQPEWLLPTTHRPHPCSLVRSIARWMLEPLFTPISRRLSPDSAGVRFQRASSSIPVNCWGVPYRHLFEPISVRGSGGDGQ